MATYTAINGDTFELIARKQYGTEQEAGRVKKANAGVSEPLVAGTVLVIPPAPNAPKNKSQKAPANDINEVSVLIEGKRFRFWNSLIFNRTLDSIDSIEFSTPFEADRAEFRETFKPFSFKPLEVHVGGDLSFTGTLIGVRPTLGNKEKTLSASGYALPGVLNDCNVPASAFPIEYNEQNLKDIATTIAGYFGLSVVFKYDPGPVFESVTCQPSEKSLSFLANLAKQRNFVINNTESGALRFDRSVDIGKPVAILRQGESPVLSVTPSFSEQEYYSHITGIQPTIVGIPGVQFTAKNRFLSGAVRPLTFEAPDTEDSNVAEAVNAKLGRMFGNIVSYDISVDTWRDPSGVLWTPNTTLKLNAPGAMVYNPYEFLIRSVSFTKDSDAESAVLNVVLPGAFSGKIPEALPWG